MSYLSSEIKDCTDHRVLVGKHRSVCKVLVGNCLGKQ